MPEHDNNNGSTRESIPSLPRENSDVTHIEIQAPSAPIGSDAGQESSPQLPRRNWLSRVLRPSRKEKQIQALQTGYIEILETMRSIRSHLDRQASAQDLMRKTVDQFPDALDGIQHVGRAAERQIEVLSLVHGQLETNAQHGQEIIHAMHDSNKTLNMVNESSRDAAATMSTIIEQSRDVQIDLKAMHKRLEKRLMLITGMVAMIVLIGLGVGIYVALNGLGQRPAKSPALTIPESEARSSRTSGAKRPEMKGFPSSFQASDIPNEPDPFSDQTDSSFPAAVENEDLAKGNDVTMDPENGTRENTRNVNKAEESPNDSKASRSAPGEPSRIRGFHARDPSPTDNRPEPSSQFRTERSRDEPEGIKNVVRRLFSFLGDEGQEEADDQSM